ncbi:MAG: diguanylate cyclase [Helicobacteraceae bacterium]|jgi:diguanylate cyclase (GGDEF)-like protein|nr:diguanylate cyclase [Helicobacteraceae bacterium]
MLLRKNPAANAASAEGGASLASGALPRSGASGSEMDVFVRSVLDELAKDSLPPLPNYYQMYFEKLLDEKPYEFRKSVNDFIEGDGNAEDEKRMKMEQQLQDSFTIFREILQNVATLFKNVSNMTLISKRRMQESRGVNSPGALQNLTLALNNDLEKLNSTLNSQAIIIKNLYTKSAKIIQEVKGETIYDAQYGIFNKRYLVEQIKLEIAQIAKLKHESSLILAKLSKNIKDKIPNEKQLLLINRTISKLFMKTSRRSDVVAHFGEGCFAMLLKHTDEKNAARAALRITETTNGSHFFISDDEIKLEISIGIASLGGAPDPESVMVRSLDAMNQADNEKQIYVIAPAPAAPAAPASAPAPALTHAHAGERSAEKS